MLNGCHQLSDVCDRIVTANPDISPRNFLRALGSLVAGIEPGIEGIVDLARGGANEVYGKGFRPEFDDGSNGQPRHFAGTAASVAIFGSRATELVAHTFLDPADTPDGRLTAAAIEFATQVLDEALPLAETADWILENLCLPEPETSAIRIEPAPRG